MDLIIGEDDDEPKLKDITETAVSKTVAFARSGKHLARILYWCGGPKYTPIYNLSLKREQKKIRNIVNSDVVSFVTDLKNSLISR